MDTHANTQYMAELEHHLSSAVDSGVITLFKVSQRSPRSLEIRFNDAELDSFGSIVVSRRNLGAHYSLKITLYSYDGIKKCSKTLKDASLPDALSEIVSMAKDVAEIIRNAHLNTDAFKKEMVNILSPLGYVTSCESRYMAMYTAKNAKIIISFTDDGTFRASYTKTHCKTSDRAQMEAAGAIIPEKAKELISMFMKQ